MLPLLVAIACETDAPELAAEEGPVVEQTVRPPPQADVDVVLPVLPEGKTLSVNAESSSIGFTGKKITGSHEGGFKTFEGTVVMGEGVIVGTSFSIDLVGTFADNDKLGYTPRRAKELQAYAEGQSLDQIEWSDDEAAGSDDEAT